MLNLAGDNQFCQINHDLSKKNLQNKSIVYPIYNLSIKASSILSYSICFNHTVCITKDGIVQAIGENDHNQIWDSLPREIITKWTQFEIQDVYGLSYTPISVVCGCNYTLYMVKKQEDDSLQLVFVCQERNYGLPIFLNINNRKPIAIYGGLTTAAAINEDGSIIIINDLLFNDKNYTPICGKLPPDEKPISIACCDQNYFVLSSTGRLYISEKPFGNEYSFSQVEELKETKITNISGLSNQCLAVSDSGEVYGRGDPGILGFGKEGSTIEKFTKNKSLKKYDIKCAYAGSRHSLFQTTSGKILSSGYNDTGALLIEKDLSNECITTPVETIIKENASFCIAGVGISAVFVGCEVPKNCPNKQILEIERSNNSDQSRCCILI